MLGIPWWSVVRTHFHCWGLGSIPGQGTKIPQAAQHGLRKKKEEERKRKTDKKKNVYTTGKQEPFF